MARKVKINVNLDPKEAKKIEVIAAKLGVSRSTLARNLIRSGLEDAVVLNAMGVVDIVAAIRKRKRSGDLGELCKVTA